MGIFQHVGNYAAVITLDSMTPDFRAQFPRVDSKWPQCGLPRYLKSFSLAWDDDAQAGFETKLRCFASGDDSFTGNPLMTAASNSQMLYAQHRSRHVRAALTDAPDRRECAERSAAYGGLAYRLEAEIDLEARRQKPGEHVPIWPDFVGMVANTAHLLAIGWDDWATAQTRRLIRLLRGQCVMLNAEKFVAQHFVLRLLADWQGISSHWTWPKASRKDPLIERILVIWRDAASTEELGYLLGVLCDRHLLQSSTSDRKHFDFGHTWEFYDAYEVLVVRALRQRLGLTVPEVDHPLAAMQFAQPQATSAAWEDGLIATVKQRARSLLPRWDLDGADFDPA